MSVINNDCESCPKDESLNCPLRMSDGRLFTDYRPRCLVNSVTAASEQGMDSYKYRMFMVNNATDIMKHNMMKAYDNARCKPASSSAPVPAPAYKQVCSATSCLFEPVNPLDGVGLSKN